MATVTTLMTSSCPVLPMLQMRKKEVEKEAENKIAIILTEMSKKKDDLEHLEKMPLVKMGGHELWTFFRALTNIQEKDIHISHHSADRSVACAIDDLTQFLIAVRDHSNSSNKYAKEVQKHYDIKSVKNRAEFLDEKLRMILNFNVEHAQKFVNTYELATTFVETLNSGATNKQICETIDKEHERQQKKQQQ